MSKVNTRQRLKQAALAQFLEKGFAKTSIAAIEKRAGLAPRAGAFYRHFESKSALMAELARESISETPDEFDFDALAAFGDTRAELIAIAKGYQKAMERQAPFARLIEEIRLMQGAREFENEINGAMLEALMSWLATKPLGARLPPKERAALAITVFAGWLFFLGKAQQGVELEVISADEFLDFWATYWAERLDAA
ncbi:MAG: TetR/AcrR family transcriptional regulator [Maricaulaceae bacterium]|jgi:AcrR family transcriptional regulator